ncbi:MAG TPA: hypothetical protein VI455_04740 [Terriglobia bacterium]
MGTLIAVSLLVVAAIVAWAFLANKRSQVRAEQVRVRQIEESKQIEAAIARLEAAEGDLTKLPDMSEQVEGLILHPGERCFAICQGAQHVVAAHRTKYVGGSQGVSFRIAKGVRYHVGGFSGRPVTTTYEKVQDVGNLYVTTERVVFAGSREVTSIAGNKVADVRIEDDHIWVMAENRKTPLGLKLTSGVAPVMAYATRLLAQNLQA